MPERKPFFFIKYRSYSSLDVVVAIKNFKAAIELLRPSSPGFVMEVLLNEFNDLSDEKCWRDGNLKQAQKSPQKGD